MVVGTGVEGQEDLLETGFAALEIEDLVPRQRLDDEVDRSSEGDPEPVGERDDLAYAGHVFERRGRDGRRHPHLDHLERLALQVGDLLDGGEATVADDAAPG